MASSGAGGEITRSRDGVPQWSGDAANFQDYEDAALLWEQGIPYHKRYLCGPRLVGELSGTAKKFVLGKRSTWVSFQGGVEHLLSHLRMSLGKPRIPELSEMLTKYFRQSGRKRMESMSDYIVRKTDVYNRARQALSRVQKHYETGTSWRAQNVESRTWDSSSWNTGWWQQWHGSWRQDHGWDQSERGGDTRDNDQERGRGQQRDEEGAGGANSREESYESVQEHAESWSAYRPSSDSWSYGYAPEEEAWTLSTPELLPDFLQGWYMLADSGLDSHEKNMIQTAIRGNFSVSRVAQELRNQWPEEDLKRRDQNVKNMGFWQEQLDQEDEGEPGEMGMTAISLQNQGMNDAGILLIGEAEEQAQEAMAAMDQARRTLRDARARQHQVKMSRQYYMNAQKGKVSFQEKSKSTSPGITCFKCGGPHKIAQCPDRHGPSKASINVAEEHEAPFVCFHEGDQCMAVTEVGNRKSTSEAIAAGLAVVDGGATKTLASVHALEAIQEGNLKKYQHDRVIHVDPSNRPSFGFGNSSRDTCCSTTTLQVSADSKPGHLTIHTLDRGTGPVLLSVETLRKLGAVVDFQEDLFCFRNLDKSRIIQAERSSAGHQLIPLSDDMYKDAVDSCRPVPSLREFCKPS